MAYVITAACVDLKDKSCVDECPVDCIYEGLRMLYIHPDECIDCGACEPVCPVEAIYYEDDVPAAEQLYTLANQDFASLLPSTATASALGPQSFDAPLLSADPPETHSRTPRIPRRPSTPSPFGASEGDWDESKLIGLVTPKSGSTGVRQVSRLLFDGLAYVAAPARQERSEPAQEQQLSFVRRLGADHLLPSEIKRPLTRVVEHLTGRIQEIGPEGADILGRAWSHHDDALIDQLMRENEGEPATIIRSWPAPVLAFLGWLRPNMIQTLASSLGLHLEPVVVTPDYARQLLNAWRVSHPIAIPTQPIAIDLSKISDDEQHDFARQHGWQFREYAALIKERFIELAGVGADESPEISSLRWESLADGAADLRRLTRQAFPQAEGSVSLGLIGASLPEARRVLGPITEALDAVGLHRPEAETLYSYKLYVEAPVLKV